ncbi:MAG TPA: LytTR family DNA-binding domain-containing protein [Bacteroidota bacterium]|nr:LytTR family DNA-binding domain-containing protein [Bacteroidota bacterium]
MTMRLRAVVVDDEELARKRLVKLLRAFGSEIEIAGEAAHGEEAVGVITSTRPDVVFLDVQMPGFDGFEVARRLEVKPFIVFVTAYNEYALRAFEENSIDYLLKPVEHARLEKTVGKLRRLFGASSLRMDANVEKMLARLASPPPERIKVTLGDRIILVDLADVVYFEAREKYTYLHTLEKEYAIDGTLADLEGTLGGGNFVRIHRSYIVNVRFIREIVRWFAGRYKVRLKDAPGTELVVSRGYADAIRNL